MWDASLELGNAIVSAIAPITYTQDPQGVSDAAACRAEQDFSYSDKVYPVVRADIVPLARLEAAETTQGIADLISCVCISNESLISHFGFSGTVRFNLNMSKVRVWPSIFILQ
jgi:hypothetical protein